MSPGLIIFIVFIVILLLGGIAVVVVTVTQNDSTTNIIPPNVPNFPNFEQARFTLNTEEVSYFGASTQLSEDGNTMIIGSPTESTNRGAARIYTRSAGVWTLFTTLIGVNIGQSLQGTSVGLDGSGTIAAIGAPGNDSANGAVFLFRRNSSGVWQDDGEVTGTLSGNFGYSVALNDGDGKYLIVGEPAQNRAYIYFHNGSDWTFQAMLTNGDITPDAQFGFSVGISDDGQFAIIGSPNDNDNVGSVHVFRRTGTSWSLAVPKIVGDIAIGPAKQGFSVAISGTDGGTIAFGGPEDNNNIGATWVFSVSDTAVQQAKLIGTGNNGASEQGYSVRLSNSGRTLITGGPGDTNNKGAYWAFTRTELLQWEQQGKYIGSDAFNSRFGAALALSQDGTTGAIGGPLATNGSAVGAVWAFAFQVIIVN